MTLVSLLAILFHLYPLEKGNPEIIIQKVILEDVKEFERQNEKDVSEIVLIKEYVNFEFKYNSESRKYLNLLYGGKAVDSLINEDKEWGDLLKNYTLISEENRNGLITEIKEVNDNIFKPGKMVSFISKKSEEKIFKKKGWQKFYKRHPQSNGIYQIFPPIKKDDKAIIYMGVSNGQLNGVGKLIFLQYKKEYEIIAKLEIWAS